MKPKWQHATHSSVSVLTAYVALAQLPAGPHGQTKCPTSCCASNNCKSSGSTSKCCAIPPSIFNTACCLNACRNLLFPSSLTSNSPVCRIRAWLSRLVCEFVTVTVDEHGCPFRHATHSGSCRRRC